MMRISLMVSSLPGAEKVTPLSVGIMHCQYGLFRTGLTSSSYCGSKYIRPLSVVSNATSEWLIPVNLVST